MGLKIKLTVIFTVIMLLFTGAKSIKLSAKSICLFDPVSGGIVYGYNETDKMRPASITKIITAVTALEFGKPDEIVTVADEAAGVEGSSIYLKKGEKIELINLIYGMMLHSGNDAAAAIAYHFGYEKFVGEMNVMAKKAGAVDSNFENPSGLDGGAHFVTAADMAKITAYAMKNPVFAEVVSTKRKILQTEEPGKPMYLKNHNKLLWLYESALGVKTGFTKKAGRTLVSYAKKDGKELICVSLNDPDDWNDHIKLYNKYFE